jgi:hypothetical protein
LIIRDHIHSKAGDQPAKRGQKGLGRAIEAPGSELMARSDGFAAGGDPVIVWFRDGPRMSGRRRALTALAKVRSGNN